MKNLLVLLPLSLSLAIAACAPTTTDNVSAQASCADRQMIGRFDPSQDLLIANYDSKPDVDDLQAVAALGSVLKNPGFSCVEYIATAGAYGTQDGDFIPAAKLFDLAFGDNWLDAHSDRAKTVRALSAKAKATLEAGGQVWITEAGQSDVTAAMLATLPEDARDKVHVVQHSDWNESVTSPEALAYVKSNTQYHKIADGNYPDNGTPAFNTKDNAAWALLLSDPLHGAVWTEARRLSLKYNPVADYVNPAVAAGGLDFSDTVEAAWVFGFDDMYGVDEFASRFSSTR